MKEQKNWLALQFASRSGVDQQPANMADLALVAEQFCNVI